MASELPKPVFIPSNPQDKNIEKFRRAINTKRNINLETYDDLQKYSVNPSTTLDFWQDVWDYVGIKASKLSATVRNAIDKD
jgi:flagellar hook-associated protein FlgK